MKLFTGLCLAALMPAAASALTLDDLLVQKGLITKAEAKEASSGSGTKVYWNKGTRIEFPDNGFAAQINTLIQTRYTFTDNESGPNKSSFEMTKARIIISGTALNKEFSYKLNGDFVGTTTDGTKSPDLRDAFIAWKPIDSGEIRLGQYKTLSSRQYNTEDDALQFPDRSVASDYFDSGRQDGLTGYWTTLDGALKVSAGMYNGSSDGEGINKPGVDTKQTGIFNVRWNALGQINPFVEGDLDNSQDLGLTVGSSYAHASFNKDFGGGLGVDGGAKDTIAVDAMAKYQGASLAAEYYYANTNTDNTPAAESSPSGFYVQAGYFFVPSKWELAARYSRVSCDKGAASGKCAGDDSLSGVDVSLNHYWWGNYLKGSLAYARLSENPVGSGSDVDTNRWLLFLSASL